MAMLLLSLHFLEPDRAVPTRIVASIEESQRQIAAQGEDQNTIWGRGETAATATAAACCHRPAAAADATGNLAVTNIPSSDHHHYHCFLMIAIETPYQITLSPRARWPFL